MIPRYARPEMVAIWEPQTKFKIWFEIEAHACDALAELGVIPKEAAATIWARARDVTFDVDRIDAIEREVKHDVIAFLTHLAEFVGPDSRFVHQGKRTQPLVGGVLSSRGAAACALGAGAGAGAAAVCATGASWPVATCSGIADE